MQCHCWPGARLTACERFWGCCADLDATGLSVQDRQIGFVFQSYALFNHMTVAENIGFGIRMRKLAVDKATRCALRPARRIQFTVCLP